ncbi:MAG: hypothetical protein Q3962_05840 [Corynebacterium sp.]|nr:hypothetical protein [Corynebacterium sp.]
MRRKGTGTKLALAVAALGLFLGASPALVSADEPSTPVNLFAQEVSPALAYMHPSEDGTHVLFDRAAAKANLSVSEFAQGEWLEGRFAGPIPPMGIRLWGNWCGPGISGPGAPIDLFDESCMHHDACYMVRGLFDCYCDQLLMRETAINRRFLSPQTQRLVDPTIAIFALGEKVCRSH